MSDRKFTFDVIREDSFCNKILIRYSNKFDNEKDVFKDIETLKKTIEKTLQMNIFYSAEIFNPQQKEIAELKESLMSFNADVKSKEHIIYILGEQNIKLKEEMKSENARWSNELDLQLKYSAYERKEKEKLKERIKQLNTDDVSKSLDGELQEALNEFSKTQGTKEPTKKRF